LIGFLLSVKITANNRISLINAPNGYGKPAFYECIILGLFGEPIPSRYLKSSSHYILNKRKKHKVDSSNIDIYFSLNNIDYRIYRVFYENETKGVKRLQFVSIELYEKNVLIKTTANLVNKWVNENICTFGAPWSTIRPAQKSISTGDFQPRGAWRLSSKT
jgi:DNA repair exonuclease SbcCD ATPase subunit